MSEHEPNNDPKQTKYRGMKQIKMIGVHLNKIIDSQVNQLWLDGKQCAMVDHASRHSMQSGNEAILEEDNQ